MHMEKKRTITFLVVALLSLAQNGDSQRRGKRRRAAKLRNMQTRRRSRAAPALPEAIAEYTLRLKRTRKMCGSIMIGVAFI